MTEINGPGPLCVATCCGDFIRSMYRHHMQWCKCRKTFVDGGGAYLRCGEAVRLATPEEIMAHAVPTKGKPKSKRKGGL